MRPIDEDIATVRRLAHTTLGAGADPKRAAKARRDAALSILIGCTQRRETPTAEQEAEAVASRLAYRQVMGWTT